MTPSSSASVVVPRAEEPVAPSEAVDGRHRVRAVLVGAPVAGLAYAVLAGGVVPGWVSLLLLTGLLVVLPTAPGLSRRVALNGSLLIGWVPVLWWVRWPVTVDHGGFVVAGCLGFLAALVSGAKRPATELRRLLPAPRSVDALLVLGAGLALAAMWRWATAGSPQRALVALLPGADNYAHFMMFSTLRAYGAVTPALGTAPDGSRWAFDVYPQGFHSLVATIGELSSPGRTVGPGSLVTYTHAVAAVVVLGLLVVTAAVVSLPALRDRPLVALPVVMVMWTALLWEPGQNLLADGFANFWLAATAVAAALLLSLAPRRRLAMPEVVAVAGLLVAVAHAWAPLIVIAAPAALALFHPFRETLRDPSLRRRLAVALGVLAVAGLGVLKALVTLFAGVQVKTLVEAFGGIHGTNPAPAFALILTALYVCTMAPVLALRRGADREVVQVAHRARLLVLAPAAALAVSVVLFVAQLRTVGTSSYYFLKFFMGFELVLAAFVPAVVGLLVASGRGRGRRTAVRVVAALAVTVLASQAFGQFPRRPAPLLDAQRDGTASVGRPLSSARIAAGILAAADASGSSRSIERDYVAIGPDRAAQAFYPDGWYHGILASLSERVARRLDVLRVRVHDVDDATRVTRRLLQRSAGTTVVVDPQYVTPLRAALGPQLAPRVTSWSGVSSVETQ